MSGCTCPRDPKTIPSAKRVTLFEPGAVTRNGNVTNTDRSKVIVYHADCPVHGYRVLEGEEVE